MDSLGPGAETHKSWKPLLNTIYVFRGSAECSAQWKAHNFFVQIARRAPQPGLLTPESYKVKKNAPNAHSF